MAQALFLIMNKAYVNNYNINFLSAIHSWTEGDSPF